MPEEYKKKMQARQEKRRQREAKRLERVEHSRIVLCLILISFLQLKKQQEKRNAKKKGQEDKKEPKKPKERKKKKPPKRKQRGDAWLNPLNHFVSFVPYQLNSKEMRICELDGCRK